VKYPFDGSQGLILVDARVDGPTGHTHMVLALDTGATSTLINLERLVSIGYDPVSSADRSRVVTGSGLEFVAQLRVERVVALGRERTSFAIAAHTLPPAVGVDGLLGLDFLRGSHLTIDFEKGLISLADTP